ncbi:MAG: D-alanine--D-alanine ligase family protein [Ilumatobacteraceae bacterium]
MTIDVRTNVIVIFGGESAEHDVSCVTAAHVIRTLDRATYDVQLVGIARDGRWLSCAVPNSDVERLKVEGTPTSLDALLAATAHRQSVVIPLLHGPMGEDGTIQGALEMAHVAYVGSGVLASAVAMDKAMTKSVLRSAGIPQPRWVAMRRDDVSLQRLDAIAGELGWPVFVKPANMGSSVGVAKARTIDELVAGAHEALEYDDWILVEEAIHGREIEVAVLGNDSPRASVPGEIIPGREFYDYDDKYLGDTAQLLVPAPLSDQQADTVRALALQVYREVRAEGMARVDFFFEEDGRGFLVSEVNTIPGFTPISMYPKLWQASGMTYPGLVNELVSLALSRHTGRRRRVER